MIITKQDGMPQKLDKWISKWLNITLLTSKAQWHVFP